MRSIYSVNSISLLSIYLVNFISSLWQCLVWEPHEPPSHFRRITKFASSQTFSARNPTWCYNLPKVFCFLADSDNEKKEASISDGEWNFVWKAKPQSRCKWTNRVSEARLWVQSKSTAVFNRLRMPIKFGRYIQLLFVKVDTSTQCCLSCGLKPVTPQMKIEHYK